MSSRHALEAFWALMRGMTLTCTGTRLPPFCSMPVQAARQGVDGAFNNGFVRMDPTTGCTGASHAQLRAGAWQT